MKTRLTLLMLVLLWIPTARVAVAAEGETPTLDREFATPQREAKPYTWWMWLGTVNPPEAITRDLEEFHAKGLVGATIKPSSMRAISYPDEKVVLEGKKYRKVKTDEYEGKSAEKPSGRVTFLSDESIVAIRHAAKEANRLGLDLGLQIGTTAPPEFVGIEFFAQTIDWSVASFQGPGLFKETLPIPKGEGKNGEKGKKWEGDEEDKEQHSALT